MPRPLRIQYPGAWYHVMNRGRRGEPIIADKADYGQFVELLEETTQIWNLQTSASCLMPNHYIISWSRHRMPISPDACGTSTAFTLSTSNVLTIAVDCYGSKAEGYG